MTLFDWINQILVHKKDWDKFEESDHKSFQPYMINRFLSMDNEFLEIINHFQKYSMNSWMTFINGSILYFLIH